MLLLCFALFGVMIVIAGVGFGVYFVFFSQKLLQTKCEDFTLKAAQQLNLNDTGGKLNNLQARSRELVYASRELSNETDNEDYRQFAPLAAQVMNQSREGAILVESERKKYIAVTLKKLRTMAKEASAAGDGNLALANMSAREMQIIDFKVGNMTEANKKCTSNVEVLEGPPELFQWDLEKQYIQRGKGVNLYRAAVNLKLPAPDNDLDFELAPLAAPVKGTLAPLRLTTGNNFQSTLALRSEGKDLPGTCKLCPSAVQVSMTASVKENAAGNLQATTKATDTACTNGASPELK